MVVESSFWSALVSHAYSDATALPIVMLQAILLGGIGTSGTALILLTKDVLLKMLHTVLFGVALTLVFLYSPFALYLLSAIPIVYFIYALFHSISFLIKLTVAAFVINVVLLIGAMLYLWPLSLSALSLLPIYLGLLYLTNQNENEVQRGPILKVGIIGDTLGLPNRASLREAYQTQRQLDPGPAMMVIVFLEGIEQVNKHLGREFGDTLLAESANRIKQQLHDKHIFSIPCGDSISRVAHLGGLYFAFVCNTTNNPSLHEQLIDDILLSTAQPFYVNNCTLEVSARASYVNCYEESGQFDNLIACAYLALDSLPDHIVCPYQQHMQISQFEKRARIRELANITVQEEFEIYFQPAFKKQRGEIAFIELLLRWPHPKLGLLSAEQFIDDIRLAGLAMPVAYFMVERAAEMAMALKMENFNIPLSINVFGSEMLQEDFIRFMNRVLLEHHLQSGDLHLEYAPSTLASANSHNQLRIAKLREMGVHVGIDRFGESPIVLTALADLNVDYVKLASSLTCQPQPEGIEHVVAELLAMQRQRGVKIICGGIENQQQLDFANKFNPEAIQGHLLGQPISSKGLMSWVHQWYFEQNS